MIAPVSSMDALPPALRHAVRALVRALPASGAELTPSVAERIARVVRAGEPWLGADPALAELGYWMIAPAQVPALRRAGCAWLAAFPSLETARRLTAVLAESELAPAVRDRAIATLGDRCARGQHPTVQWPTDALQLADDTLVRLANVATAAGRIASDELAPALRPVQAEVVAAVLARAPGLWGAAIEHAAIPALARVLAVSIDDLAPPHRIRALRLIAATLGDEAVPMLVARAPRAALAERLEMQQLAVAIAGDAHLAALTSTARAAGPPIAALAEARAAWHVANRGVIPTVRGLRVARATATLPAAERVAACTRAADDLAALAPFGREPEGSYYALWGQMVRGAGDPGRARPLLAAHPDGASLVGELAIEDLARRGRVAQVVAAAHDQERIALGALWLARCGRPLAALELAAASPVHSPEAVCARALACFRAGRPDLVERMLALDPPTAEPCAERSEPFPGPHERWLVEHGAAPLALTTVLAGARAITALARPAPDDAEPDSPSIAALAEVDRRVARRLVGATVYIAGELPAATSDALARQLATAGARIVDGPFASVDFYVRGEREPAELVARLERQGTRRLYPGELAGELGVG